MKYRGKGRLTIPGVAVASRVFPATGQKFNSSPIVDAQRRLALGRSASSQPVTCSRSLVDCDQLAPFLAFHLWARFDIRGGGEAHP